MSLPISQHDLPPDPSCLTPRSLSGSPCRRQTPLAVGLAAMDLKDRRQRSLTRGPSGKEPGFSSSSLDAGECRVPTQKSYSSSDTLKALDQEARLRYAGCMAELVHREADEFPQQGNFTLAELGICEPAPHQSAYCSDLGLLHRAYSLSAGSDADSDPEGALSPERAVQLWGGHEIKSRRSSGLSSRENSALTLTDSDNDKSDEESDTWLQSAPMTACHCAKGGA
ncbi:hypothetical protein ANANG_G00074100 [Anguilla anguilla]|uniref:Teneurin N-terminal domain-containing protein n=1 Tax=Anguilla anguilla TaxID=7936 RepID=A0A9D3S3J7_ANGAN|nr:hypothetical protein ANANG_G00074100 [Anguilla anguilla]